MKTKSKGPWVSRFAIKFFTFLLGLLVYWVLGFIVDDIRSIDGPKYSQIKKHFIDKRLISKRGLLKEKIINIDNQIRNLTANQRIVELSSQSLQKTINQLLELKKIRLQKDIEQKEQERRNFQANLDLFVKKQQQFQQLNQDIAKLVAQKQQLQKNLKQTEKHIVNQEIPAKIEFKRLSHKHHLSIAFYQLSVLIPLVLIAAFLIVKERQSIYFPIFLACGVAALIKAGLVVHYYFPTRYFKYALIAILILCIVRLLIYFIHTIKSPKKQWLLKQYKEAYERFLCPVCDYPIRTGPRRFLYWTRRTVNKIIVPNSEAQDEPYTCPSCGTTLFEDCPACKKVRHAGLPHCSHCGILKKEQGKY